MKIKKKIVYIFLKKFFEKKKKKKCHDPFGHFPEKKKSHGTIYTCRNI